MTLFELLLEVLKSPIVIACTIGIILYGSLILTVAKKHVRRKAPVPKKLSDIKIPKPVKEKPVLDKNVDTSDLGLA
jgi:hypothetical protein